MEVGRELDKLVAEAMGFAEFWQDPQTGEWYAYHPNHTNLEDERIPIRRYSTDGYAAWEAWEWLEQNSPWGQIALSRSGKDQIHVLQLLPPVTRDFPHSWGIEGIALSDTYPHTICLAVLAATKEKKSANA